MCSASARMLPWVTGPNGGGEWADHTRSVPTSTDIPAGMATQSRLCFLCSEEAANLNQPYVPAHKYMLTQKTVVMLHANHSGKTCGKLTQAFGFSIFIATCTITTEACLS